jgi:signal transduction histidine kinase
MTTVLVVARDEPLRQQLQQALAGASIFTAHDTDDALRQLVRIDIDLIVWAPSGRTGDPRFLERAKHYSPASVTLVVGAGAANSDVADVHLPDASAPEQMQSAVAQALEKHRRLRERAVDRPRRRSELVIAPDGPATSLAAPRLLREFTRILTSGFDLARLLEAFVEGVTDFLRPARLALLLPDGDGRVYKVRAQRGLAPHIEASVRLTTQRGLGHWLAAEGRPVAINDAMDPEVVREFDLLQGVLAVPLLAHGELMAVLVVGPPIVRTGYAAQDVENLFDLATHVAHAIHGIALHERMQRMSESNERILEHMSNGVIAIGPDERVTLMNRRAAEILQLETAAILDHDLRVLPSPLGDMLYETLVNGRARPPSEIQLAYRSLWIEVSTYPLHGERSRGAVLVFEDLTAQKELAAQRLQAERFDLMTRFVARIADEIKNPLVSINTFMELIEERFDDADFRHQFSSVVGRDVRRLVEVFEKLTGLVSQSDLNFTTVDLHAIVDEAAATMQMGDGTSARPVEIVVRPEAAPVLVKVDRGHLRKALCYLMSYLAHHSPDRPSVTITITRQRDAGDPDDVRVLVASGTADVEAHDLEHIFDPVRMVQDNLIDIGPAVSQRIVEGLGGRLTLRRARREVAFVMRLPVTI